MTSNPYLSPFASVQTLCVFPLKIFKMFLLLLFTAKVCSEYMSVLQYTALLCSLLAMKHSGDIICCIIHESLQESSEIFHRSMSAHVDCKSALYKHVANGLPVVDVELLTFVYHKLNASSTNYSFSEAYCQNAKAV